MKSIFSKETATYVKKLVAKWDKVKATQVIKKEEYGAGRETVIGKLHWDNPDLIFVLVTDREEGYEGSQAQIGITKDGKVRWEYQSHCSCNSYEDSTGIGQEFDPKLSRKDYQLSEIPLDWDTIIKENIIKMLTCIKSKTK